MDMSRLRQRKATRQTAMDCLIWSGIPGNGPKIGFVFGPCTKQHANTPRCSETNCATSSKADPICATNPIAIGTALRRAAQTRPTAPPAIPVFGWFMRLDVFCLWPEPLSQRSFDVRYS